MPSRDTLREMTKEAELLARAVQMGVFKREEDLVRAIAEAMKRVAEDNIKREKKSTAPPDPRIKEFLDWFADAYLAAQGIPYVVSWVKESALVKRLLVNLSVSDLQACARIMLDPATRDTLIEASERGLGMFALKINWLNLQRTHDAKREAASVAAEAAAALKATMAAKADAAWAAKLLEAEALVAALPAPEAQRLTAVAEAEDRLHTHRTRMQPEAYAKAVRGCTIRLVMEAAGRQTVAHGLAVVLGRAG